MRFNREFNGNCPCQGCEERQPGTGCHDRCGKFREWRAKVDKRNEAERAYHQANNTISEDQKLTRYGRWAMERPMFIRQWL